MSAAPAPGAAPLARLQVFYDGACPLCRREIGFLRRRRGADRIDWIDIAATDSPEVAPGLARCDALARMHVRTAGGETVSGAAAFVAIWTALPLTRPLGRLCAWPPLLRMLERAYGGFLRGRPWLQAWVARRTGEPVGRPPVSCAPRANTALSPPTAAAARRPSASEPRA